MSKSEEARTDATRELDCSNAGRGVWLVKVPKYIAKKWLKAQNDIEVGKLKIIKYPGQKSQVSLSLSDVAMAIDPEEKIPKDHRFDVQAVNKQTLGVFSQNSDSDKNDTKLMMEGTIVEKLECRPYADQTYMKMKAKAMVIAAQPKRKVEQLDSVVTTFKPISDHKHNIEYDRRKKTDGKKSRTDKTAVMDMLFNAFEKHQYYNIKDLVTITNQPISYLKEILKEICEYSVKNPHKNTWHLKAEYRHYSAEKKSEEKKGSGGGGDDAAKMTDSEEEDF